MIIYIQIISYCVQYYILPNIIYFFFYNYKFLNQKLKLNYFKFIIYLFENLKDFKILLIKTDYIDFSKLIYDFNILALFGYQDNCNNYFSFLLVKNNVFNKNKITILNFLINMININDFYIYISSIFLKNFFFLKKLNKHFSKLKYYKKDSIYYLNTTNMDLLINSLNINYNKFIFKNNL